MPSCRPRLSALLLLSLFVSLPASAAVLVPDGADGSCEGVFATLHRADGALLADEVRLNPFTVGCQFGPRAAAASGSTSTTGTPTTPGSPPASPPPGR